MMQSFEPLFRVQYEPVTILGRHPPQFRNANKVMLYELAFSKRAVDAPPIEITRWKERRVATMRLDRSCNVQIAPNFFDYVRVSPDASTHEWHVNFADPRLFCAYGSGLFAQDEMQVAEHPILANVLEAMRAEGREAITSDVDGATPILVRNVERRLSISTDHNAAEGRPHGLYGNQFAASSPEAIRRATRVIEPPTITNLIAMAAPAGGHGEYDEAEIVSIFATAFTAFDAAMQESLRAGATSATIHTGFWGCGAFGGNRKLMVMLQYLAARAVGIGQLVFHTGDVNGAAEARAALDVAESIASRCGPQCDLESVASRVAALGYRWGVSDGN